eukprot:TRINITY_DN10239_c0_g1_i1.p3 TRINITY_DN10239_c0_g1~~TRINITY_DN10239_c0_g1_i1.p3  ORF type:complete len:129 (-),score=34.44 TRINITY_DN10239_c0_g1_i1:1241-1627(-)
MSAVDCSYGLSKTLYLPLRFLTYSTASTSTAPATKPPTIIETNVATSIDEFEAVLSTARALGVDEGRSAKVVEAGSGDERGDGDDGDGGGDGDGDGEGGDGDGAGPGAGVGAGDGDGDGGVGDVPAVG